MTDPSTTLVMGAAIGYSTRQIEPFLKSLRNAGFTGDVMLLVSPSVAREAARDPVFRGVRFIPVRQWFPVRYHIVRRRLLVALFWAPQRLISWILMRVLAPFRHERFVGRLCSMIAQRLYPPSETRYLHYLHFLHNNPQYSRILISDVRDVLFQTDPFVQLPEAGLSVSMEIADYNIEDEPYNAGWIRALYGQTMLDKVGSNPVSCSGVSYADRSSMLNYLHLMAREILGMGFKATTTALGGYDQGIHNVLLYTGQLNPVRKMYSLASPVATVNGVEESSLCFDDSGYLVSKDNSIIAIVHQYDRVPSLRDRLLPLVMDQ